MKAFMLVSNGFDAASKVSLSKMLSNIGVKVDLISDTSGVVNGWEGNDFGLSYPIKKNVADTMAADYDCMIIPEGIRSINKLKSNLHVKRLLKFFLLSKKLIVGINDAEALLALCEESEGLSFEEADSLKTAGHVVIAPSSASYDELSQFIRNWIDHISDEGQIAA